MFTAGAVYISSEFWKQLYTQWYTPALHAALATKPGSWSKQVCSLYTTYSDKRHLMVHVSHLSNKANHA